eukprot:2717564-Prymnesium_polylepis.1
MQAELLFGFPLSTTTLSVRTALHAEGLTDLTQQYQLGSEDPGAREPRRSSASRCNWLGCIARCAQSAP